MFNKIKKYIAVAIVAASIIGTVQVPVNAASSEENNKGNSYSSGGINSWKDPS